ncbi:hypothetical protein DERF_014361 [Dermatophagoides farinae]|uniref:Uncharacterized protein n=1 Tax=Dermatophagoides farinae TaxID=6954 RepID=A0A922HLS8_DERFA|nr:hypothetical protein DERF_014361 [Dermatophagoides farinae]
MMTFCTEKKLLHIITDEEEEEEKKELLTIVQNDVKYGETRKVKKKLMAIIMCHRWIKALEIFFRISLELNVEDDEDDR